VVRISVGLEHVDDLTVDLLHALDESLSRTPGSAPLAR
jgi:cystathionine beta-lyase/cystathionine gamma-synthase